MFRQLFFFFLRGESTPTADHLFLLSVCMNAVCRRTCACGEIVNTCKCTTVEFQEKVQSGGGKCKEQM